MRGLVLEGGGAKGSYQIGAYRALMESGHSFDYIVGTSIGSLNGAMIAQGDIDVAEEIWSNIKFSTVVDVDDDKMKSLFDWDLSNLSFEGLHQKFGIVQSIFRNKGFDITPFKELLDKYIDEAKVRSSSMKFGLVTVGISDLKPLEIFIDDMEEGSLKNYLLASSYLPVFKQEPIEGKYYLDGGFYANIPYKMVDDLCEELYIIGLFPNKGKNIFEDKSKYKYIKPREELCDIFQFMQETADYNIKLGYHDTRKFLDGLLGDKYYIYGLEEKTALDVIINTAQSLNKSDALENLKSYLEIDFNNHCVDMGISVDISYREILALILDFIATEMDLERFKIYTMKELATEIKHSDKYTEFIMNKEFEAILIEELIK